MLLLASVVIEADGAGHREDRILVQPKPGAGRALAARFHAKRGAKVLAELPELEGLQLVRVPEGMTAGELVAECNASGIFEYAEPDHLVHAAVSPNDPAYANGSLWGLQNSGQSNGTPDADIDAPEAWDVVHDAPDVIVAIIDSGIRLDHEDLVDNLWTNPAEIPGNGVDDDGNGYVDDVHGINAITGSGDPSDDNGHGSHVSGIVGARGGNGVGVTRVAWKVRLMPLKFLDDGGDGSIFDAVRCVNYAIAHGADVINASWVGDEFNISLRRAIESSNRSGIVFVTASGNDGVNIDGTGNFYPPNFSTENIVSVTATDRNDRLAGFSNIGAQDVDLAAPGEVIRSTSNAGVSGYKSMNGTSMAAPYVSGAFALMRARFPEESHLDLIARVFAAVDPLEELQGVTSTGGRLNLANALKTELVPDFSIVLQSTSVPATVLFSDLTDGTITSREWSFGDGSPDVSDESDPSHVYLGSGEFDAVLTVGNDEGAFASVTNTVSVFANPVFSEVSFDWIETEQPTEHTFAGNESWSEGTLPFLFHFYDGVYDTVRISPHGFVSFGNDGLAEKINREIPLQPAPNNALFACWDFLDIELSGTITTGVVGEAPFRGFVVTWSDIMTRSSPRATLTFQIVIEETTGHVRYNYLDVDPGSSQGGGRRATVGVENADGSAGVMYGYNGTRTLSNGQTILWTPPAATHFEYMGPEAFSFDAIGGAGCSLMNVSPTSIAWNADDRSPWLLVDPGSGTLAPGESVDLLVVPGFSNPEGDVGMLSGYVKFGSDADDERTFLVQASWNGVVAPSLSVAGFSETLELRLQGSPGGRFAIQASANLTGWETIFTDTADPDGVLVFSDDVSGVGRRFYRAVLAEE